MAAKSEVMKEAPWPAKEQKEYTELGIIWVIYNKNKEREIEKENGELKQSR